MPQIGAITDRNPTTGVKGVWYLATWDGTWHGLTTAQFPNVPKNPQATYLARLSTAWSNAMNATSIVSVPLSELDPAIQQNPEPFCTVNLGTGMYDMQMLVFDIRVTNDNPPTYTYSVSDGAGSSS